MIYYYYIYKNFNNMAQNVHHATIHMSQVGKKFIAQIVVKKTKAKKEKGKKVV